MDVTCKQIDGFRFIYSLPFSKDTLLVEDTRYSNNLHIDQSEHIRAISSYLEQNSWQLAEVLDTEVGALPIPLHSDFKPKASEGDYIYSGMAAGLFHPVTGYSIGHAFRFADFCA